MAGGFKPIRGSRIITGHPAARGLFKCWLLNEGGGDRVFDVVERTVGSLGGGVWWKGGDCGPCVEFDGTSGYVQLDDEDERYVSGGGFSWSIRVKFRQLPTEADALPILLDYICVGGHCWYATGAPWNGRLAATFYKASGGNVAIHGPLVEVGRWYSMTCVYDGSDASLYVDGVLCNSANVGAVKTGVDALLRLGHSVGYSPEAEIAYVMFWDRPLGADEIRPLAREPFSMFERSTVPQSFLPVVGISGDCGETSDALARPGLCERDIWTGGSLDIERAWLREALFGGMGDTGFKLGTVLSGGWFWMRQAGLAAVYRGVRMDGVDFDRIIAAGDVDCRQLQPPAYVPHNPGSTWYYVLRRFNGFGICERTFGAATRVRIGGDGRLAAGRANGVFGADGAQVTANAVRLRWFYEPLGQAGEPERFNVYSDADSGQINYEAVVGSTEYRGRGFYECTVESLQAGRHTFAVVSQTSEGGESDAAIIAVAVGTDGVPAPDVEAHVL